MAKMRLYYSPSSPYARKVRVLAIETGLDKKIDMVNVALTPVAPNADVDKHNPIGKIPALSIKNRLRVAILTDSSRSGFPQDERPGDLLAHSVFRHHTSALNL